ncbi:2-hydroxy-6-oxo-2,4-heptadienoate hydrolase [Gammaproteobacteria bacterium]|nr:2-hydroxy-6-oxo-2,4-heptadienoate hydrolase [Gammaproteobacteria bacterium]
MHTLTLPERHAPRRTVIALHCSGAAGRVFDTYRPLLGPDVRLIAPDLLGSGAEPAWPHGAAVSLDSELERLAPLLARAPQGVHLIGHSYGGALALQAALRWPQCVRSLTLYEPVRFRLLGEASPAWNEIVGIGRRIVALSAARRGDAAAQLFVDYWSGAGTWAALSAPRQAVVAERMPKVAAEFEALFGDDVPAADFAALDMPMVVLAGDRSPSPALSVAQQLVRLCRQARLVRLPGRGHMGALEDPAAVVRELPWTTSALSKAA